MDKLSEIMAAKRQALSKQIRPVRDQELERLGRMQTQGGSFLKALSRKDRLSVIAEIKRKSPSAGEIAAATLDSEIAAATRCAVTTAAAAVRSALALCLRTLAPTLAHFQNPQHPPLPDPTWAGAASASA